MLLFITTLGFVCWMMCLYCESGAAQEYIKELKRIWASWGFPTRLVMTVLLVWAASTGGAKGPNPVSSFFNVMFWHGSDIWPLLDSSQKNAAAASNITTSTNSINSATNSAAEAVAFVNTNTVAVLSFDWHQPNRLPEHARQNVLGRTVWVHPTNIAGTVYEDHYVAFNAAATTNPAVIMIEYARRLDDGTIERYSASTVTNSYPDTVVLNMQSGNHTCYWFRCEVPAAFTNICVLRDWNGEALFGSPEGSGRGFDLLGTLVIDDGNDIWVGATTNIVVDIYNSRYPVRNGIIGEIIYGFEE